MHEGMWQRFNFSYEKLKKKTTDKREVLIPVLLYEVYYDRIQYAKI